MTRFCFAAFAAALVSAGAQASIVQVQAVSAVDGRNGNLFFNNGPLGGVQLGNTVTMSFTVDSNNYVNSSMQPGFVRGYVIDPASFTLTMGSTTVHMMSPYPSSLAPAMFVIGHNLPAVDKFYLTDNSSIDFPVGAYTDAVGQFDNYSTDFGLTYAHDTLSSVDILSAVGTYTWSGLQQPTWLVNDSFVTRLEMYSFDHMTISVIPAPAAVGAFVPAMLLVRRRRTA